MEPQTAENINDFTSEYCKKSSGSRTSDLGVLMHKFDSDQFRQFMRLLQLGDPEAVIELRLWASEAETATPSVDTSITRTHSLKLLRKPPKTLGESTARSMS